MILSEDISCQSAAFSTKSPAPSGISVGLHVNIDMKIAIVAAIVDLVPINIIGASLQRLIVILLYSHALC